MNLKRPKANSESGLSLVQIQVLWVLKYKSLQDNEHILVSTEVLIFCLNESFYIKNNINNIKHRWCCITWKIPDTINVNDYPKLYSSVNDMLKWAFKLVVPSSELDMKWETSPFEVSGRSAFFLVKAAIHLSDFYLVYVFLFDIACDFAEELPDIFIIFIHVIMGNMGCVLKGVREWLHEYFIARWNIIKKKKTLFGEIGFLAFSELIPCSWEFGLLAVIWK